VVRCLLAAVLFGATAPAASELAGEIPAFTLAGLARTSAASASLLLNAELAATVVIATLFFREHLGRKLAVGVALITAASAVLTWEPGAAIDMGPCSSSPRACAGASTTASRRPSSTSRPSTSSH